MSDQAANADLGLANAAAAEGPARHAPALQAWFTERFPGRRVIEVSDLTAPSEGLSNETVLFDVTFDVDGTKSTERYVARIQAPGQALAPPQTDRCASPVEFEFHLHSAVASAGAGPVAPIIGFEPDAKHLGRPFYVMACVEGRVPGVNPSFHTEGFMKDEATGAQRGAIAAATLQALAAVHAVDWRQTPLADLFTAEPDHLHQLDVYGTDFARQLADRPFPLVDRTLAWLEATDPGGYRAGIVWGDARLGNVIVGADYGPAALLDWENGFVGPCEADVGWWLFAERVYHDVLQIPPLEGWPDRAAHLRLYEEAAGRSVEHVRYWEVFAAIRMAHGTLLLADRMAEAGMLPPGFEQLGFENPVTMALTALLDDPSGDV